MDHFPEKTFGLTENPLKPESYLDIHFWKQRVVIFFLGCKNKWTWWEHARYLGEENEDEDDTTIKRKMKNWWHNWWWWWWWRWIRWWWWWWWWCCCCCCLFCCCPSSSSSSCAVPRRPHGGRHPNVQPNQAPSNFRIRGTLCRKTYTPLFQ